MGSEMCIRDRDKPKFTKDILANKTRSLLAFALLNRYPVWDTKLASKVYTNLLRQMDKFGGLKNAHFERSEILVPAVEGALDIALYEKDAKKFLVVVNRLAVSIDQNRISKLVMEEYGNDLSLINSDGETIQVKDFAVFTN